MATTMTRLIAIDMDGTLVGPDGQVSPRNSAAIQAAERAGIEVVISTGRRHSYAMRVLRDLGLNQESALISSNGAVVRTVGARLIERTLLDGTTAEWLCGHMNGFRNALLLTFDRVQPDGDDTYGALVVEESRELQGSIGRWMTANERYIETVRPIEDALGREGMIQMMLCGTIEQMRAAQAQMLVDPRVLAVGHAGNEDTVVTEAALHKTEYPERDLCIVDILPAGCSKGAAVMKLAERRGVAREEILAIGDNWNDVSMFEVAGSAVLMGNAPNDLKEVAASRGWRSGSRHDEDGVAEAIEALLEDELCVRHS
jgi:hydroxymethylpyrimidine pyrophosphatase-like HAD family hydrolase